MSLAVVIAYVFNNDAPRKGTMSKQIKATIQAKGLSIALHSTSQADYISLTDIAKYRSDAPADVVKKLDALKGNH